MYNYNEIEIYASWVIDEIKKAKKNHKKADMGRIKFFGNQIKVWAEQKIVFDEGKNVGKYCQGLD